MRHPPLIQRDAIDVRSWALDAEFAVFPQGAREKEARFAPDDPSSLPCPCIKPGRRYLFKRSRRVYADQFWAEIVAYRLGCLLGVTVPPAMAAFNSDTGESAALIEWFYADGEERFVWAGDLLQSLRPDFDRETGRDHNLGDNLFLLRAMRFAGTLDPADRPQAWWTRALTFDALIGNTDRHQDNWGLLYRTVAGADVARLAPIFDNGTSLGFEFPAEAARTWSSQRLDRYVDRGWHHVRQARDLPQPRHQALIRNILGMWPASRAVFEEMLEGVSVGAMAEALADLLHLRMPLPLSEARFDFILRLLSRRLELLMELL